MAVGVTKLEGEAIPPSERRPGVSAVFRVTDEDGTAHYFSDDVQAAQKAVELSEAQRDV